MVLRHDPDGVLAVGQASHAWLCGQLARAWGNERFGRVQPLDEVALGAEQHDVGMARWDIDPPRNRMTGLPQSFMEMGAEANATLWARGPERLVTQSRYAALLAIIHGRRLYERDDLELDGDAARAAVSAFLAHARQLEARLVDSLRADPATAPHVAAASLDRNSQLVWIWDTISLALLLDWAPLALESVPAADGATVDVELAPREGQVIGASLKPWPFEAPAVRVHCEGRRLRHGFETDARLAKALETAPWETLTFELVPGR